MERAREGVAILLNYVGHSVVIDFGCVSSRILWIKFKLSRVKIRVVVVYGSTEGIGEEREGFWNELDKTVDRIGNGYRLCGSGDLCFSVASLVRDRPHPQELHSSAMDHSRTHASAVPVYTDGPNLARGWVARQSSPHLKRSGPFPRVPPSLQNWQPFS